MQQEFNLSLKDRFEALQDLATDPSYVQTLYNSFETALENTAKTIIGEHKPSHGPHWVSQETTELRVMRDVAKAKFQHSRKPDHRAQWRNIADDVTKSYQRDETRYLKEELDVLNTAAATGQVNRTWAVINKIAGKNKANNNKVRKRDGTQIKNTKDLLSERQAYFKDLPINTDPISREEIEIAMRRLKSGKAAGLDNSITPDMLKYGGSFMRETIHTICSNVFSEKVAPSQWKTNLIIPIPKKGNLTSMSNYRGITLMSVAAKIYNRVLLDRIRPIVDPYLRNNQAGFREGRGCVDQVYIPRRVIEGAAPQQLPLYTTFVDFQKAFDSVDRNLMFAILRHYGVLKTS